MRPFALHPAFQLIVHSVPAHQPLAHRKASGKRSAGRTAATIENAPHCRAGIHSSRQQAAQARLHACAPSSCSGAPQHCHPALPGAPPAALSIFAMPSALATTAAAVAFAHAHVRAIVVALLIQSTLQLLPAIFLLFGSPMVVMFADSLGKSGNAVAERNKFLAFAMTSAVVLLAALSFLITSLLGIYAGWNVLGRPEGAALAITSLVRRPNASCPMHAEAITASVRDGAAVALPEDAIHSRARRGWCLI